MATFILADLMQPPHYGFIAIPVSGLAKCYFKIRGKNPRLLHISLLDQNDALTCK